MSEKRAVLKKTRCEIKLHTNVLYNSQILCNFAAQNQTGSWPCGWEDYITLAISLLPALESDGTALLPLAHMRART